MGGKKSKTQCHQPYPPYGYVSPSISDSTPRHLYSESYFDSNRRSQVQSRYTRIGDDYRSLDQVTEALARAGLESSNLIVGIDFTQSNEWTGARSYNRKSLHHLGDSLNPYQQAISIIGRTLSVFDEDNLVPCYGFGDATTHDQEVFSFLPDDKPCNGFEEALTRYREIVPRIRLAGPTSFAPIIETAIGIVDKTGGQYHVLLIIADGQVTRSVNTDIGQLSSQERSTIDAIVKASEYPLSIILVGVGDGPWDMMRQFDDNIPSRTFDNFQFVNFTEIMLKNVPISQKETEFSLAALMEIPSQYKATLDLQLLRYGTVMGGLLSEKFLDTSLSIPFVGPPLNTPSLQKYKRMVDAWGGWSQFQVLLQTLKKVASKHGVSIPTVAVRYILDQPAVAGSMIGVRLGLAEHVKDTNAVFSLVLDEDVNSIQEVSKKGKDLLRVIGDCGDEYRRA